MDSEKVNERMNKMEEMIKRARKMENLMDYDSFSFFPDVRLPPKFKMPTLDKFDEVAQSLNILNMSVSHVSFFHPSLNSWNHPDTILQG